MSGLEGKVVLVTGASSGIGAGAAKSFAALKCRLSLVARNLDNLNSVAEACRAAGAAEVLVLSKDLSVAEECISAVEDTAVHFKGVDVLVNSAGIVVTGDTASLPLDDYDRCMNINTRAAFLLSQRAIPHLRKTRGSIVHVSSVTGLRAFPDVVAYNMSKAAVDQLARTTALEEAKNGVRVNAVNPGVIVTEIHKRGTECLSSC